MREGAGAGAVGEEGGEEGGKAVREAGGDGGRGVGSSSALLVRQRPAGTPGAAVVVLHGGREHSREVSRGWHLAALRMRPVLRAAVAATDRQDVLVGEVRYRYRGWNATADPVHDTVRALDELRRTVGEVPVTLVGHSMGGRAALRAAADPAVRGVLALAPWCPPGEPVDHLGGKRIVVLHGDRDRVTDPGSPPSTSDGHGGRRRRRASSSSAAVTTPCSGGAPTGTVPPPRSSPNSCDRSRSSRVSPARPARRTAPCRGDRGRSARRRRGVVPRVAGARPGHLRAVHRDRFGAPMVTRTRAIGDNTMTSPRSVPLSNRQETSQKRRFAPSDRRPCPKQVLPCRPARPSTKAEPPR